MKKIYNIIILLLTGVSFAQVIISRDNTNLTVYPSAGLDIRSDRQAVAFPEYKITDFTQYPSTYPAAPKDGSIVFSPNKVGTDETKYGYFYWDADSNKWIKLLDANSFSSDFDYSVPYFFSNFTPPTGAGDGTSDGLDLYFNLPGAQIDNTSGIVYNNTQVANHVIGSPLNTSYWTVVPVFQPSFKFEKPANAMIKVSSMVMKPGAGNYDFSIAMAIFVDDILIATKTFPFISLSNATSCVRNTLTMMGALDNVTPGVNHNIKVGYRVVGNNYFQYRNGTTGGSPNRNYYEFNNERLDRGKFIIGKGVTDDNTITNRTACNVNNFEIPFNITVYGVSSRN